MTYAFHLESFGWSDSIREEIWGIWEVLRGFRRVGKVRRRCFRHSPEPCARPPSVELLDFDDFDVESARSKDVILDEFSRFRESVS